MIAKVRVLCSAAACALLAGCAEAYLPRLDGAPLNPDIEYLRTGEMLEGVKCAFTAFMIEREQELRDQRFSRDDTIRQIEESEKNDNPASVTNAALRYQFDPYTLHKPRNFPSCHGFDKHYEPKKGCVPKACDGSGLGISVWDYRKGTKPGKETEDNGCTPIPDYSRFALNDTQNASIEVTLLAINSGFLLMSQIDAPKTIFAPFWTPGNKSTSAPFPQIQTTPKQTTTFDLTAVMPQSVHLYKQGAPATTRAPSEVPAARLHLAEIQRTFGTFNLANAEKEGRDVESPPLNLQAEREKLENARKAFTERFQPSVMPPSILDAEIKVLDAEIAKAANGTRTATAEQDEALRGRCKTPSRRPKSEPATLCAPTLRSSATSKRSARRSKPTSIRTLSP
jgi:hypothetical protein